MIAFFKIKKGKVYRAGSREPSMYVDINLKERSVAQSKKIAQTTIAQNLSSILIL